MNIGEKYPLYTSFAHLSGGLCVGFSCLAAGITIGIVGDAGVRANAKQQKLFVGMLLILIFGEALALYGVIVGLVLAMKGTNCLLFFLSLSPTFLPLSFFFHSLSLILLLVPCKSNKE
jgi:F0F1-type ATP synthase membrane subunit c/vacuolar-type H+-ATPase subunit K